MFYLRSLATLIFAFFFLVLSGATTAAAASTSDVLPPTSITASGASHAAANVTYTQGPDVNGKPTYVNGAITVSWNSASSAWLVWEGLEDLFSAYYFSGDDVADPTLVTTWETIGSFGPNMPTFASTSPSAGFSITESGGTTVATENGASDSFDVLLSVQPTTDVVLSVVSAEATKLTVDKALLTFTNGNWNIPQSR